MNTNTSIRNNASSTTSEKNLPLQYVLLLVALTIPFYLFGGGKLPIPVNLPVSALMLVNPILAAIILIYRQDGFAGIQRLFKRVFDYPNIQNKIWFLPSLFLMPLIYGLSYAIMRWIGRSLPDPNISLLLVLVIFIIYFLEAILEELGWQGYLFDSLQNRRGAFQASIIVGLVWQFWHLIPLIQAQNSAGWIFWHILEGVALRVLMAWIYNNTGRSIFTAILMHATTNVSWSLFPIFGSAYNPFFTAVLTCLAAGLVIFVWRGKNMTQNRYAHARG
jgi:membrane protease YdiL (CAAX protease family)